MKNKAMLIKYAAMFGAVIILMSSCLSTKVTKNYMRTAEKEPFDAIIVPGVPFGQKAWSSILKMRIDWAAHLYKSGIAKNIIFSGSSVHSPYVESKIMALYAEKLGVPREHIYTEEQAEHSSENLYYSYKMAKENGFNKVALATDPFQNFFLKSFVNKMMLNDLDFLPVAFDVLKKIEVETPEIDPSPAYVENFVSLVDRQDSRTRRHGTMGKFIKYEVGDSPEEKRRKRIENKRGSIAQNF